MDYRQEIKQLIKSNPFSYFSLLRKKRYAYLLDFINRNTVFLDNSFYSTKLSIRAYCAANNIVDFPRCIHCNSKLNEKNFINGIKGFRQECSDCLKAINNKKHIVGRANSVIAKKQQQLLDIVNSSETLAEKIVRLQNIIPRSDFLICMRYSGILASIREQISHAVPALDDSHSLAEKIYWVLCSLTEFPRCKQCGNPLDSSHNFMSLDVGYRDFCCVSCMEQNVDIQERKKQTSIDNCGYEHWTQNAKLFQGFKQRNIERYGVNFYIETDEFKKQSKKTMLEHYGVEYPLQSSILKEKFIKSVKQFSNDKKQKILDSQVNTCRKHYNVDFPMQSKIIQDKARKSMMQSLGVEFPMQSAVIRQQAMSTCLKNNGVAHPLQSASIRRKQSESMPIGYLYNDIDFDSLPELAYYIYLTDNKINFIYQPNLNLRYFDRDKVEHTYFPDFLLLDSNQIIEIKGDHFFDKFGNPISPYSHESWKDKYEFMLKLGVQVFKESDYAKFIEYCNAKFNDKKWHFKFKKVKQKIKEKNMILNTDYKTVKEVKELIADLPDDAEVIFREVSPDMSSLRHGVEMLQTDAELDAEDARELEEAKKNN